MIILWIAVIVIGTILTIWGSHKLSSELGKKDLVRKSHIIPDFLLIDFEIKSVLDSVLTQQILSEVKPRIHIPGDSIDNQENIPLTTFFNEKLFNENLQAKKNYELSENIYKELRNFDLMAISRSKDSSVCISLNKNTNKIIFNKKDKTLKESYIEVIDYNQMLNEFHFGYHNIQLNVENQKLSRFITDLDKGSLELHLITKAHVKALENIKLKTKSTDYFKGTEITKDSIGSYKAKLNLLLY